MKIWRAVPVFVALLFPLPSSQVKDLLPVANVHAAAQPPDTKIDLIGVSVICDRVTSIKGILESNSQDKVQDIETNLNTIKSHMEDLRTLKSPLVKYFEALLGPLIERTKTRIKFNKTDSTKSLDCLLPEYKTVAETLSGSFMGKVD